MNVREMVMWFDSTLTYCRVQIPALAYLERSEKMARGEDEYGNYFGSSFFHIVRSSSKNRKECWGKQEYYAPNNESCRTCDCSVSCKYEVCGEHDPYFD